MHENDYNSESPKPTARIPEIKTQLENILTEYNLDYKVTVSYHDQNYVYIVVTVDNVGNKTKIPVIRSSWIDSLVVSFTTACRYAAKSDHKKSFKRILSEASIEFLEEFDTIIVAKKKFLFDENEKLIDII